MPRGGSRPGAGRKQGAATKKTRAVADQAAAVGETPLEFMLRRMRDDDAPIADRMDMAKAAAPFMHAKLSSIEAKVEGDVQHTVTSIQLVGPEG